MSGAGPDTRRAASMWLGIVLYENSPEELGRLVRSLALNREASGAPDFHVVWFDNSPTDRLRAVVEELVPGADYRASGANLGFGAAHNRVMAEAFASPAVRSYVCVNPDGVLHPRCLAELASEAARGARVGLVEARLFPDEHPKAYDPDTHETAWCSGCVLLMTREMHSTCGGFDERFFMYCEDVDLSWRARAAGFSTRVAPGALVHHYTVTRAVSTRRELSVRRSAMLLGAKYGDARFARARHAEYLALGGEPLPLPPIERPGRAAARVVDFRHVFDFAEPRW